jgi:hypothetical protein
VDELKAPGKPFDISKRAVWEAWEKVKANKGAPGVDAVTVAEFESDLKNNLYKIWNRLSSGTYFPPPVRAVEIPKSRGGGTRILGVPSVGDRVAQTVVAGVIEARAEPVFHPDSYGYRPGRSALDAVGVGDRDAAVAQARRDLFSYAVVDAYARSFTQAGFGDAVAAGVEKSGRYVRRSHPDDARPLIVGDPARGFAVLRPRLAVACCPRLGTQDPPIGAADGSALTMRRSAPTGSICAPVSPGSADERIADPHALSEPARLIWSCRSRIRGVINARTPTLDNDLGHG